MRHLHPIEKHKDTIKDLKQYENELNFKDIDFPVKLKGIEKFQKQNPQLKGINVFSINENNKSYPLLINKKDRQDTIDLLLCEKDGIPHYCLITNFSRLVSSQITKNTSKGKYFCKKCLSVFISLIKFQTHIEYCSNN